MTCVVGVIHEGHVWMGADSAGANGWSLQIRSDTKVFQRGPYLMGFTTSFRMGQLLRYSLDPTDPVDNTDIDAFMATAFIDDVRKCLKDGGFAKKESEREAGGEFLVGVYGRLFTVHDDYQVSEQLTPYAAVGCGADVALGVMYATDSMAPSPRLQMALNAAEHHSAGVRGPFTILGPAAIPPRRSVAAEE